jgi:glucose-6-phosphate isomerase
MLPFTYFYLTPKTSVPTVPSMGLGEHFQRHWLWFEDVGFGIDTSNIFMPDDVEQRLECPLQAALEAMNRLENGALANGTEQRMVGHYWLRNPDLAPSKEISWAIRETGKRLREFAFAVRTGKIAAKNGPFTDLLCIGIGGSALGPQLLLSALAEPPTPLRVHFMDNTDPAGFLRTFRNIDGRWDHTLILVTSKSGSTPEPRNALRAVEQVLGERGLRLAERAVAITAENSELDRRASEEGWLIRFPMWDWVGGRTSITSAVGLLPAALCGIDTDAFLAGASNMDRLTRAKESNPALRLALAWYFATGGVGSRGMVILPYADALVDLARYLQQLVMESLGKRHNRRQQDVFQGITVYGNRGSTDQHSYVQQLRDGLGSNFVTFIEILRRRGVAAGGALGTAGEYLEGFLLGTGEALAAERRQSLTITLREISPFSLGMLVALYERAVGFYAEFIDVNAYDQPGVEAGKKAADRLLALRSEVELFLKKEGKRPNEIDAQTVATSLGRNDDLKMIFKWMEFMRAQ